MNFLINLHHSVFGAIERMGDKWLLGLLARLVFVAVLLLYFWNSGWGKISGIGVDDSAYFTIMGFEKFEAFGADVANIPFYWKIIVHLGTYGELLLPLLIVVGLFTRIAAAGMAIFVIVQSYVDIAVHGVDAGTIGKLFDRHSESVIMDQRTLWMLIFALLVIKGAGALSLDHVLRNWWKGRSA